MNAQLDLFGHITVPPYKPKKLLPGESHWWDKMFNKIFVHDFPFRGPTKSHLVLYGDMRYGKTQGQIDHLMGCPSEDWDKEVLLYLLT